MMAKYGPLELQDDTSVNTDAKVYYEKRNGVIQIAKAEFLANGEDGRAARISTDSDGKPLSGESLRRVGQVRRQPRHVPQGVRQSHVGRFLRSRLRQSGGRL